MVRYPGGVRRSSSFETSTIQTPIPISNMGDSDPEEGVSNLFDLSGQHAALYTQHSGDVNVLPAHVVHPIGEAVHCGLKKLPGELYDVEHPLNNIV